MTALSAAFPELIFTLQGVGEAAGDVWTKVFKAGVKSEKYGRLLDPDENEALEEVLKILEQAVEYGLSPIGKDRARNLIAKLGDQS